VSPCPSRAELEILLQEASADATALEEHVAFCLGCQAVLEDLTAGATAVRERLAVGDDHLAPQPHLLDRLRHACRVEADPDSPTLHRAGALFNPVEVPGYEILGELGRGGMGVVYKARHVALDRIVALKMLRSDGDSLISDLARFRGEALALARLRHPNIVQIHEAGEHDGKLYLALEFVEGGTLANKLQRAPQPARPSAALVEVLARAIHAAHENGIVHRDLKPSNVLLTDDGTPTITDFGVAKRLDATAVQTQTGVLVGTPSYMAPEQVEGAGGRALTSAAALIDVYALGALLYECLTGRPPFLAETVLETLLEVRQREPLSPRELQPKIPRDLETICLKCLRKEPHRRYPDAVDLADDLGRWLRGDPIRARPVGVVEHAARWVWRHPVVSGLTAAVVLVSVLGYLGAERGRVEAEEQATQANHEKAEKEEALTAADAARSNLQVALVRSERQLANSHLRLAETALREADANAAVAWLGEVPEHLRSADWCHLRWRCEDCLLAVPTQHQDPVALAWMPKGLIVATGGRDGSIKMWEVRAGRQTASLRVPGGLVAMAWSPDNRRLATAHQGGPGVKVWNVQDGTEALSLNTPNGNPNCVSFSPDGRLLAAGGADRLVHVWDTQTGKETHTYRKHRHAVNRVAFARTVARVVSGDAGGGLRVWDPGSGDDVNVFELPGNGLRRVAITPDGKHIAANPPQNNVRVWEVETGRDQSPPVRNFSDGHFAFGLTFSPDGKSLVTSRTSQYGGALSVWDVATGQRKLTLRGLHTGGASELAYSFDGSLLAALTRDGLLKIFDPDGQRAYHPLIAHVGPVQAVAFSPDGKSLASGGVRRGPTPPHPGEVFVWDLDTLRPRLSLRGHTDGVFGVAYHPRGAELATVSADRTVRLWDGQSGKEGLTLRGHTVPVYAVAFSPDGGRLATAGGEPGAPGELKLWDAATGQELASLAGHEREVRCVAFSPDGKLLASGGAVGEGVVKVWDIAEGREILSITGQGDLLPGVPFNRDGTRLAGGGVDGSVRLWDVETGRTVWTRRGHTKAVECLSFSADGERLISGSMDTNLKLWDTVTGQETLTLKGHASRVHAVAVGPDGRRVASGSDEGEILLWPGVR
jgi:eukaryotic-like serine/threonine-protein kinase